MWLCYLNFNCSIEFKKDGWRWIMCEKWIYKYGKGIVLFYFFMRELFFLWLIMINIIIRLGI